MRRSGAGFLTGAIQTFADVDGRRAAHPRFQEAEFRAEPRAGRRASRRSRRRRAARRRSSRSPGCWRRARMSWRFRARGYPQRLDENLGALRVTLTPDEVARIAAAVPAGAAAGTRYPRRRHAGGVHLAVCGTLGRRRVGRACAGRGGCWRARVGWAGFGRGARCHARLGAGFICRGRAIRGGDTGMAVREMAHAAVPPEPCVRGAQTKTDRRSDRPLPTALFK